MPSSSRLGWVKPVICPHHPRTDIAVLFLVGSLLFEPAADAKPVPPYGLVSRPPTKVYLEMPETDQGAPPQLLSQTGAFKNTRDLTPADSLIPYDINVAFYSDGAAKARWLSVPQGNPSDSKIRYAPTGDWQFPKGTVFVKHFEMATIESHPYQKRRLATRLLVRDAKGGVYGVTYKWRLDNSDADLLATNLIETLPIQTPPVLERRPGIIPAGRIVEPAIRQRPVASSD